MYNYNKLCERLVTRHLNIHQDASKDSLPALHMLQSVYRRNHLTETAITRVVSDILMAADIGDMSVLALLDLSTAFNMVDHSILFHHLLVSHNITSSVLTWFESYLHQRTRAVWHSGETTSLVFVGCGMQCSIRLGARSSALPFIYLGHTLHHSRTRISMSVLCWWHPALFLSQLKVVASNAVSMRFMSGLPGIDFG